MLLEPQEIGRRLDEAGDYIFINGQIKGAAYEIGGTAVCSVGAIAAVTLMTEVPYQLVSGFLIEGIMNIEFPSRRLAHEYLRVVGALDEYLAATLGYLCPGPARTRVAFWNDEVVTEDDCVDTFKKASKVYYGLALAEL